MNRETPSSQSNGKFIGSATLQGGTSAAGIHLAAPAGNGHSQTLRDAEASLMRKIFRRCHRAMVAAVGNTPLPVEFLVALTANESGGNPKASRFEPGVYTHLMAVAAGKSAAYGAITQRLLEQQMEAEARGKGADYHGLFLNEAFALNHSAALAGIAQEELRELATSWGFTQIMGYHVVGSSRTVQDLLNPDLHYPVTVRLLSEFGRAFRLDLSHDFEALLRCWNSGHPAGKTFDPLYVENGLRRMKEYDAMLKEADAANAAQGEN
jgi:hypothetical protein